MIKGFKFGRKYRVIKGWRNNYVATDASSLKGERLLRDHEIKTNDILQLIETWKEGIWVYSCFKCLKSNMYLKLSDLTIMRIYLEDIKPNYSKIWRDINAKI